MFLKIKNRIFQFFRKIVNQIRYKRISSQNSQRLNSLRNLYNGKKCFILGNGPSLLKCDLTLLKNEITIASNANFLIWDQMGYSPTFLTVEDNLVAEDRANHFAKIKTTTKVFPQDLLYCLKPDAQSIYIDFRRHYTGFPKFSDNFSGKVFWGGTVSYLNMQMAYYLGFKEIYLIGFDHSYQVSASDKIVNSVIKSEGDDSNHIHPDYFGKGYRWHDPKVDRMENAYTKAKEFLEEKNIKIVNATIGGKLEVFKRVDYHKLFNK